jgi:membrane protein YqaA with SNARE-associated domain
MSSGLKMLLRQPVWWLCIVATAGSFAGVVSGYVQLATVILFYGYAAGRLHEQYRIAERARQKAKWELEQVIATSHVALSTFGDDMPADVREYGEESVSTAIEALHLVDDCAPGRFGRLLRF